MFYCTLVQRPNHHTTTLVQCEHSINHSDLSDNAFPTQFLTSSQQNESREDI